MVERSVGRVEKRQQFEDLLNDGRTQRLFVDMEAYGMRWKLMDVCCRPRATHNKISNKIYADNENLDGQIAHPLQID